MGAVDFGYPAVSSVAQLRETVQQAAQKTAKGRWIRGWGMNYEKYPDGTGRICGILMMFRRTIRFALFM